MNTFLKFTGELPSPTLQLLLNENHYSMLTFKEMIVEQKCSECSCQAKGSIQPSNSQGGSLGSSSTAKYNLPPRRGNSQRVFWSESDTNSILTFQEVNRMY